MSHLRGVLVDAAFGMPEGKNRPKKDALNLSNVEFLFETDVGRVIVQHTLAATKSQPDWYDTELFEREVNSMKKLPTRNLHYVSKFVEPESIVRELLEEYNFPEDLDLVSIDVDGPDYHLLRAILLSKFRPRVVVIEHGHGYNWSKRWIPLNLRLVPRLKRKFVYKSGGGKSDAKKSGEFEHKMFASSAISLAELGAAFGYEAVYVGYGDVILVRREILDAYESEVGDATGLRPGYDVLASPGEEAEYFSKLHTKIYTVCRKFVRSASAALETVSDGPLRQQWVARRSPPSTPPPI